MIRIENMDKMLSTAEAAKALGISYSRLYQLIRAGRIKHQQIAGCILIDSDAVASFERRKPGRPRVKGGE
jgi:excisionase family DNA binding protein